MNSQRFSTAASDATLRQHPSVTVPCPDCEIRFPLQLLVVELLRKNQVLRMELQEARSKLTRTSESLLGQDLY